MKRLLLVVQCMLLPAGTVISADADDPTGIDHRENDSEAIKLYALHQWEERQNALNTVRYSLSSVNTIPKAELGALGDSPDTGGTDDPSVGETQLYPLEDTLLESRCNLLIDLEHSRIRKEYRSQTFVVPLREFRPHYTVQLFDGRNLQRYRPRAENRGVSYEPGPANPELSIHSDGWRPESLFKVDDIPIYLAHGVCFYGPAHDSGQGRIRHPIDTDVFSVRRIDRSTSGEPSHVLLRAVPRGSNPQRRSDEYLVDLERDGAVVRWTRFAGDVPTIISDIEYQQIEAQWLPREFTISMFNALTQKTRVTTQWKVDDIELNPAVKSAEFHMEPTPGMVVEKDDEPYRAAEDGQLVATSWEQLMASSERDWFRIIWQCVLAIVLLSVVIAAYLWRRRRIRGPLSSSKKGT